MHEADTVWIIPNPWDVGSEQQKGIAENIERLAETGIAGFSIEDYSRDHHRLYAFPEAIERVQQ